MTAGHPVHFSALPPSLAAGISSTFPRLRLEVTILNLARLRVCVGQQEEEALCREWLHREEQEKLSSLCRPKRHIEWLGGRICVKEALLAFLKGAGPLSANVSAPRLQIVAAPSGRPMLRQGAVAGKMATPHISISHSGEYAMAVAAAVPCGIDIQENRETLGRIKEKFCGAAEEKILTRVLAALAPLERLSLLWAAKESIKKAAILERMPGFLELTLHRIDTFAPDRRGCFLFTLEYVIADQGQPGALALSPPPFQVLVCLHQNYGIGLCVAPAPAAPETSHA
jgi:phosphopantetheinyl transferase (holo-ACP synthase)